MSFFNVSVSTWGSDAHISVQVSVSAYTHTIAFNKKNSNLDI
jgi:hypothetical protein